MAYRVAFGRPPAVAAEAMVATSQPLATRAGLRALERGGTAADAALAAAAVLCVTEPMWTGIGGDAFAIVWREGRVEALDAAGPAPAGADPAAPVEVNGPRSVTVPGSVAGWAALAERYGRLGLDACLAEAIDAAERGFAVAPRAAAAWSPAPAELGPRPSAGERVRFPELAATLRRIAERGPEALYTGPVARAIAEASWLEEDDLAAYRPRWVEPLRAEYRGVDVLELPPPTQGLAALEGLRLLSEREPTLRNQVECVRQALQHAFATVRDGGTTYLCAVDGDRTAVSFIQSLFERFGSGVVAPGTGIVLQNRGAGFAISGAVEPGRRPFHTLIPGLLVRDRDLLGPFGIHGGLIQAQAHVQFVSALVDEGLDPQAALDKSRFRIDGGRVLLEQGLWERAGELAGLGLEVVRETDPFAFGGGQAILAEGEALFGGSDPRKDGYAGGL